MGKTQVTDLDWDNLGFAYHDLPYRYRAVYRNGAWEPGELITDSDFQISEAAVALHYGQQAFEGLKAYRRPDGGVNLFRPDQNAARMARSAERLRMPAYPEDLFVEAVKQVVAPDKKLLI
mgnify:FL=1